MEKKEWRCCNKVEVVSGVTAADAATLRATKTAAEMDSGNMKVTCECACACCVKKDVIVRRAV